MKTIAHSFAGPRGFNQDHVLQEAAHGSYALFAVADGIGGQAGGALASSLATTLLHRTFKYEPIDDKTAKTFFSDSCDAIIRAFDRVANSFLFTKDMGTTLSAVLTDGKIAHYFHVGDSRIYHKSGGKVSQVTDDHTEAAELVKQGIFSEKEAQSYKRRSVLTEWLGKTSTPAFQIGSFNCSIGDTILIATDGLYSLLNGDAELWSADISAELERKIVSYILNTERDDDASFVLIEV